MTTDLKPAVSADGEGLEPHPQMLRLRREIALKNRQLERETSRRRRVEKALWQSKEKYRSLIESFQDIYFRTDLKGRITVISPSVQTEGGYSPREVIGTQVSRYFTSGEEYETLSQALRQAGQLRDHELRLKRRDGSVLTTSLNAHYIRDPQGRPRRIVGVLRNITARKQAQEQIRKYQETLELMVAERTRKLERAKQELINKAMEAGRAQLSAMVLHNIGNAITPVNVQIEALLAHPTDWMAEYLQRCYGELRDHRKDLSTYVTEDPRGREVFTYLGELIGDFETQQRRQHQAVAAIQGAVAYIAEILSLQQAYAASGQENKELIDLNTIVRDALQMQAASLEKRRIAVKEELMPNLPRLLIDKNRLMQVIVNFIKNSYEAIDEMIGDGSEAWIAISSFAEKGEVGLEIRDNGVGIEADSLETIFEFGHSSKGSSGFGLHYCKMFVEANQGRLKISSEGPGQGATVSVRFEGQRRKDP